MKLKRAKTATLGISLAAAIALMVPAYASAGAGFYCNLNIPANSWCNSGGWHNVTYNRGFYAGTTPVVRVGIRQLLPNGSLINRKFDDMLVSTNSAGQYSYSQAANASSNPHTIGGYTEWSGTSRLAPGAGRISSDTTNGEKLAVNYSAPARTVGKKVYSGGISVEGFPCLKEQIGDEFTEGCSSSTSNPGVDVLISEDKSADLPDGRARVFGRVVDGVKSVRVSLGDSKIVAAPVVNGVFAVELDGDASAPPKVRLVR